MRTYTQNSFNFTAEHSVAVISSAQKFILPIPKWTASEGEPLNYPDGEKKGTPIVDWSGNSIGENGIVFFNDKDKTYQAASGDGNAVIIINNVTETQAKFLTDKTRSYNSDPTKLTLKEVKDVLQCARENGMGDMYNSDQNFIRNKMSAVGHKQSYGLYKRDDRDICQAVYVPGKGQFNGPAATPQQFEEGAIILKQGNDVRLIQPDSFKETYRNQDGSPIDLEQIKEKSAHWQRLVSTTNSDNGHQL